jgi:hypothetical protein
MTSHRTMGPTTARRNPGSGDESAGVARSAPVANDSIPIVRHVVNGRRTRIADETRSRIIDAAQRVPTPTLREIAQATGIKSGTVRNVLLRAGVKRGRAGNKPLRKQDRRDRAREMRAGGATLEAIGMSLGVSRERARQLVSLTYAGEVSS